MSAVWSSCSGVQRRAVTAEDGPLTMPAPAHVQAISTRVELDVWMPPPNSRLAALYSERAQRLVRLVESLERSLRSG
jgi:hypothetical protein